MSAVEQFCINLAFRRRIFSGYHELYKNQIDAKLSTAQSTTGTCVCAQKGLFQA